jgi:uncharacterized phage protein (TIGR02216 family)
MTGPGNGRTRLPGHDERRVRPFPWDEAIGFGLGVLRLSPEAFWRMTPRELAAAIRAATGRGGAPLARGDFEQLMKRFPDGRSQ